MQSFVVVVCYNTDENVVCLNHTRFLLSDLDLVLDIALYFYDCVLSFDPINH